MSISQAQIAEISMEVDIEASEQKVWKALTTDIGKWWPAEFFSGGETGKRSYYLEAKPGGAMGESWDSGGGVIWANVVGVEPNKRLQVTGTSFPGWGGPAQWLGVWELSANGKNTRLKFTENSIGYVSEGYEADKDKGWRFLWDALAAHVSGKPAPVWQD
jgi:uncharacterized protein YndB with AHSA1/START domain